jgi:hypothetical protein
VNRFQCKGALALAVLLATVPGLGASAATQRKPAAKSSADVVTRRLSLLNAEAVKVLRGLQGDNGALYRAEGQVRLDLRPGKGGAQAKNRRFIPEGIDSIVALPADNSLLVQGTEDAVTELASTVRFIDVAPASVRLDAQVLRFDFAPDGLEGYQVVSAPRILTLDRHASAIRVSGGESGVAISLTPRVNRDGSVTVTGTLTLLGPRDQPLRKATFAGIVGRERSLFVGGVTDSKDPAVIAVVRRGLLPQKPGRYTVHLLQITPKIITPR